MAILVMLNWWYTKGWLWIIDLSKHRLETISRTFAVGVLLKTWFSPWKQIHEEATFTTFFRIMVDNAVSRVIGGVVRGTILLWAFILSLLIVMAGIFSLIVWPFLPALTVILVILALSGVSL